MSGLKGKKVGDSLQQKLFPKNRRKEVDHMTESENTPELARHCFHFRLINQGKVGDVVKVGIVLPLLLVFKINLSATKMNSEKLPTGGGVWG